MLFFGNFVITYVIMQNEIFDYCRIATQSLLSPNMHAELNNEALQWRNNLGKNLEKYLNVEREFSLKGQHNKSAKILQLWSKDWFPRPRIGTYDYLSSSFERYNRKRFDFFLPRDLAISSKSICVDKAKIGAPVKSADGSYMMCGLSKLQNDSACIVYSIGSANNFYFENDLLKLTRCHIHTFDCTSRRPHSHQIIRSDRFTYHKICIGNKKKFKSLIDVMHELGHTKLDMIKWDIEGFEYDIFRNILLLPNQKLPLQILFELHYRSHMKARTSWWNREKTAGEIAMLGVELYDKGYRVVSANKNRGCQSCYEYSLMRTTCI